MRNALKLSLVGLGIAALGAGGWFGYGYWTERAAIRACGMGIADACFRLAVSADRAGNVTEADDYTGLHCRARGNTEGDDQALCFVLTQKRVSEAAAR